MVQQKTIGKDKPMDRRYSPNRAKFRHQLAAGRMALLAVTAFTLINLILLLCRVEYHFLLSAAVPYYVNWLCVKLNAPGIWSVLAALLAIGLTAFFAACWVRSYRRRVFVMAAMAAYGLDTLLLAIFAFTLLDNPASCILEIVTHLGVLYLLAAADQASAAMQRMRQRARM
jgi:hypothetical protein